MLKNRKTLNRGSETMRRFTKLSGQAQSYVNGADALALSISKNKSFSDKVRENATKARKYLASGVKTVSNAIGKSHSFFVAADTLADSVSKNKAFSQSTRDLAKNSRHITTTGATLSGDYVKKGGKQSKMKIKERTGLTTVRGLSVPKSSNPTNDEVMAAIMENERRSRSNNA